VMVCCSEKELPISDAIPSGQVVYDSREVDNDDYFDDMQDTTSKVNTRAS
jgi:hypothetical protein